MQERAKAGGRWGRKRLSAAALAAGVGAIAGAAVMASGAGASVARDAGAPSCALVPSSLVKAVLGLPVGHVAASTPLPGQTRCLYPIGSNAMGVQIVFTAGSRAAFVQKEKAYTSGGALVVTGIGSGAFTPSISTSAGSTSDLYVFGSSNELDIAAIAPISKLEILAKRVAPQI